MRKRILKLFLFFFSFFVISPSRAVVSDEEMQESLASVCFEILQQESVKRLGYEVPFEDYGTFEANSAARKTDSLSWLMHAKEDLFTFREVRLGKMVLNDIFPYRQALGVKLGMPGFSTHEDQIEMISVQDPETKNNYLEACVVRRVEKNAFENWDTLRSTKTAFVEAPRVEPITFVAKEGYRFKVLVLREKIRSLPQADSLGDLVTLYVIPEVPENDFLSLYSIVERLKYDVLEKNQKALSNKKEEAIELQNWEFFDEAKIVKKNPETGLVFLGAGAVSPIFQYEGVQGLFYAELLAQSRKIVKYLVRVGDDLTDFNEAWLGYVHGLSTEKPTDILPRKKALFDLQKAVSLIRTGYRDKAQKMGVSCPHLINATQYDEARRALFDTYRQDPEKPLTLSAENEVRFLEDLWDLEQRTTKSYQFCNAKIKLKTNPPWRDPEVLACDFIESDLTELHSLKQEQETQTEAWEQALDAKKLSAEDFEKNLVTLHEMLSQKQQSILDRSCDLLVMKKKKPKVVPQKSNVEVAKPSQDTDDDVNFFRDLWEEQGVLCVTLSILIFGLFFVWFFKRKKKNV